MFGIFKGDTGPTGPTGWPGVLWYFRQEDILNLPSWTIEKSMIRADLGNAKLPGVIEDIIIEYSGSLIGSRLIALGKDYGFIGRLYEYQKSLDRRSLIAIMNYLAARFDFQKTTPWTIRDLQMIRQQIAEFKKYRAYLPDLAAKKYCNTIYFIILTYLKN